MTKQKDISLRPLREEDVDHLMTWVNDPEVIGNFANFKKPYTREEEIDYIRKIKDSETDVVFTIETTEKDYVGQVGIHNIHWPSRVARLALIIGNKEMQGRGYAQSALEAIVKHAFDQCNLHKIWLMVFEENSKARHIYKKAGFKEEGILIDEYFHRGKYHNIVRMCMLEKDYRTIKNGERK